MPWTNLVLIALKSLEILTDQGDSNDKTHVIFFVEYYLLNRQLQLNLPSRLCKSALIKYALRSFTRTPPGNLRLPSSIQCFGAYAVL